MTSRIAMLSEHASPVALLGGVDAGGQNVYVDAVSRGLGQLGYEVDVFTAHLDPAQPEAIDWADRVRVINVPVGLNGAVPKDDLWPRMPAFRDGIAEFALRTGRPYDLIHGNFWMSGWVACELRTRWSVPVVQIFHATGVTKLREQGSADTSPQVRIAVEQAVVQNVDRLIAQCPAEREELVDAYDAAAERIALIPSAVDTERFRPVPRDDARRKLGLDPACQMIVYVGRVIPRKDVRSVVQALARLVRQRRAEGVTQIPRLVVVGGESREPNPQATPEIGALQALADELGVSANVTFAGRRQPDELHLWYNAADVAVTTPWYEPFGLTPLEAMACATPVIGSDVGGISFTVADGETGFLVPPRNPDALCARLDELLRDDTLRARMGRAGRARVERLFTWSEVAARTAALYADVLERHTQPMRLQNRRLLVSTGASGPSHLGGVVD